jgi:thiol:disulfide interchange protein DsbD
MQAIMNHFHQLGIFSCLLMFSANGALAENFFRKEVDTFAEPQFLKADEAFAFQQLAIDDGIKVTWKIAPDYYLYKDRIRLDKEEPTDKAAVSFGEPEFSQRGEQKDDPNFGLVTVFHDYVEMHIPVTWVDGAAADIYDFSISYQGCAEAGLCYPPEKKQVAVIRQSD